MQKNVQNSAIKLTFNYSLYFIALKVHENCLRWINLEHGTQNKYVQAD